MIVVICLLIYEVSYLRIENLTKRKSLTFLRCSRATCPRSHMKTTVEVGAAVPNGGYHLKLSDDNLLRETYSVSVTHCLKGKILKI